MEESKDAVSVDKKMGDWEQMTHEELEFQYSPSRHSPYQSPDTIIPTYLEKVEKDIAASRAKVPWKSYPVDSTSENSLLMDVYGEDLPNDAPLLVFVHGGYWQELNKDLVGGLMNPLHKAGVMTAVLSYTLAPKGSVTQMVQEVEQGFQRCVELVRGRGSSTIVMAGWSAGAQLVAQALSASEARKHSVSSDPSLEPLSEVPGNYAKDVPTVTAESHSSTWQELKGVVSISGIYDMRPLVSTYVNNPLKLNRSSAWQLSPARASNCSALQSALPPSARCLVAVAEHDSPQFRSQADHYAACLRSAGVKNVQELLVKSSDHFKIISDLADNENPFMKQILTFIQECNS